MDDMVGNLFLFLALVFGDCCRDEYHFGIALAPIFSCMASPNHNLRNIKTIS